MTNEAFALQLPTGELVPVRSPLVIGRSTAADLVLNDPEVSRRHAAISQENGILLLVDLQSRNGTYVNERRITQPHPLQSGDVIRVGRTHLVLCHQPAPVQPGPAVAGVTVSPLHLLARISRQISGVLDAKQLLDTVTSTIQQEYAVEGVSLILVDEESASLYFASVAGIKGAALKPMHLRKGEGIAGWVIEHREPVLVADARADPRHAQRVDDALGFQTRSIICVPVASTDGSVLGALEAVNPTNKLAFDQDDLEFLSLVAQQVATSLGNARSWDALEREREVLARAAGIRRRYVAVSPQMVRLVTDAATLYAERTPLYLAGEPGTGKRLLAQVTHEAASPGGRLIEIDCRGQSAEALAAVLFGGENQGVLYGSPTTAVYLAYLPEAPHDVQVRLAHYLRSASAPERPRVVASGQAPLLSELSQGRLTPELYTLLEPGQLVLPPLRFRDEELEALIDHAVALYSDRFDRERFTFSTDALTALRAYTWPGNIEELHTVIKRLAVLSKAAVIDRAELERLVPEVLAVTPTLGRAQPLNAIERRRAALQAHALSDLASDEPARRHEALTMLERGGGPAVWEPVLRVLDDPVPWVRLRATEALVAMGAPQAVAALSTRLAQEEDAAVATRLIELLAEQGDASALTAITGRAQASSPSVRQAALRALRRLGDRTQIPVAVAAVLDPVPEVRVAALAALYTWGRRDAGQQLLAILSRGTPEERRAVCAVIGELDIGLEGLLAALASDDPAVKVAAVRALGQSARPEALQPLIAALDDPQLRTEAVRALGDLGLPGALPALFALAAGAESAFLRRAALEAIGAIGDRSALPSLVPYLEDEGMAAAALKGIVALADPAGEEAVLSLLRGGDVGLVEQAIHALGTLGTERAVASLLGGARRAAHLEEPVFDAVVAIYNRSSSRAAVLEALRAALDDEGQRLLALQLLGELADPRAVPWLLPYRDWSEEALVALLKLGQAAIPGLVQAAREQPAVQDYVRRVLTELGPTVVPDMLPLLLDRSLVSLAEGVIRSFGEEGIPELVAALESAEDPTLIARLVQMLGHVGTPQFVPYIAGFLERPEEAIRYGAIVALGDLPDPRSEAHLLACLDSEDETAVALAVLSLGRLRSATAFARFSAMLETMPGWRQRYAIAAALSNYEPHDPTVRTQLQRLIEEGLPYTASTVRAKIIDGAELLALLRDPSLSFSRKLRALSLLAELPDTDAVPLLLTLLQQPLEPALHSAVISAVAERGEAVVDSLVQMLADPTQRTVGLAVLRELKPPSAVVAVLRRVANTVQVDEPLRSALQDMGELLIGPLFDRIYEDWDLDTLTLLWSVAQVIHGEPLDLPPTVRNFTVLQERFQG